MNISGVATKTAMQTAERDTVAGGTIELLSASSQVLAILALSASGGTITGASAVVWTFTFGGGSTTTGTTTGTVAAGVGTNAASARTKTAGGVIQATLTVSLPGGGGELQLDNVSITTGQSVSVSGAITWP